MPTTPTNPPTSAARPPNSPLRLAFIGGGLNSAVGRAHYCATALDGLYRLEAGCFSRHPHINRGTADAYGIPHERTYANWQQLLQAEEGKIDAVVVLTPTSDHLAPVVASLEAGLPVICEKALAANVEEVQAIQNVERRLGGFLVVTYNYTGYPMLRELRSLIGNGKLGRLLHFEAEMPQEGFIRRSPDGAPIRPQEWRLRDGAIPTVYLDLGVHLHQIMHYLCNLRPRSVNAFHGSYGNFPEVIDFVSASVHYDNGVHGRFHFGKSMLGHRNGLTVRIYGSKASAEWIQASPETLRIAHDDGRIELIDRGGGCDVASATRYARFKAGHPAGYVEAFANLYTDIHAALHAKHAGTAMNQREIFGSDIAGDGLRFLHAMAESARNRRWIDTA